ncbi:unnamed protein product [Brassicogethes aeneus]|uniref:PHD-type domain-containing protein n=1 Tax=Brassicogethes aeneus TaxID=1431903 RepID=A0A9P0FLU3_BRAAE|nr:unnamed protein product [Brassicogethes aeneus]
MTNKKKTAKKKSPTCVICEKNLGKTKIQLQCKNCKKWAHQECTGVKNNCTFAKCEDKASCSEDDTDSEKEANDSSDTKPEATIQNKNNKKNPMPRKEYTLKDVMKKLEKIEIKHNELLNKCQEVLDENTMLKEEIKNIKAKQKLLEKQTANSITETILQKADNKDRRRM